MSSFNRKLAAKQKQSQAAEKPVPVSVAPVPQEQVQPSLTEDYYGDDQVRIVSRQTWERTLPLDRIRPNPYQARLFFDEEKIQEMALGMEQHGWVGGGLPVRPHPTEANVYELVWGERRLRAAKLAQLPSMPVVIAHFSDEELIELGLLENLHRENLTNLEEGLAYVRLLTVQDGAGKPRYSIRRLAQRIGKDKSYIEDRIVLAKVPVDVQQLAADQPDISPRILRELSMIEQPEARQPVIDGVRRGLLRVEDVREIRKDLERSSPEEKVSVATDTLVPSPSIPVLQKEKVSVATDSREQFPSLQGKPEEKVSVATDTSEQPSVVQGNSEEKVSVGTDSALRVLAKTLARDTTTFQRILQRLDEDREKMPEEQRDLLKQHLQEWRANIDGLLSRLGE